MSSQALLKSYATTGSIDIGANAQELNVASNPGFSIGDNIIVEIGGESGAGLRGTLGVGGSWPALNYADSTARLAASPPANNTYAWDRGGSTAGQIFRYVSGAWQQPDIFDPTAHPSYYYLHKAIPRSLCTTITNITGSGPFVFTLNDSATVSTTNANVYYDNVFDWYNKWGKQANSEGTPDQSIIQLESGTFAFGDSIYVQHHDGWTIQGGGEGITTLKFPKGCASGFQIGFCNNLVVKDFTLVSNAKLDGFGWRYGIMLASGDRSVTETLFGGDPPSLGNAVGHGVEFAVSPNGEARRITLIDPWDSLAFDGGSNYSSAYNCSSYVYDPRMQYIEWHFNMSSSDNCTMTDCYLWSQYMAQGFSIFTANDNKYVRFRGVNTFVALNGANRFQHIDCSITITSYPIYTGQPISTNTPIIDINTNAGTAQDGGQITRPQIIVEGPITANNNMFFGINVGANNPNISISGTYPNSCDPKGLIQFPDFQSGSDPWWWQINSDTQSVSVSGIRVIGSNPTTQINLAHGSVTNCVVDTVTGAPTVSGKQTNAEFDASYPTWYDGNCLQPRNKYIVFNI